MAQLYRRQRSAQEPPTGAGTPASSSSSVFDDNLNHNHQSHNQELLYKPGTEVGPPDLHVKRTMAACEFFKQKQKA